MPHLLLEIQSQVFYEYNFKTSEAVALLLLTCISINILVVRKKIVKKIMYMYRSNRPWFGNPESYDNLVFVRYCFNICFR